MANDSNPTRPGFDAARIVAVRKPGAFLLAQVDASQRIHGGLDKARGVGRRQSNGGVGGMIEELEHSGAPSMGPAERLLRSPRECARIERAASSFPHFSPRERTGFSQAIPGGEKHGMQAFLTIPACHEDP